MNVPVKRCLRKACSSEVLPVVEKLTVQDVVSFAQGQKQELGHVPLVSNGGVRGKLYAGFDRTFREQPVVPVTDEDKAAAKLEAPGAHGGGGGGGGGGTQSSDEGAILERRLVALETAFSMKGHGKGLPVQERMEARIWQLLEPFGLKGSDKIKSTAERLNVIENAASKLNNFDGCVSTFMV